MVHLIRTVILEFILLVEVCSSLRKVILYAENSN